MKNLGVFLKQKRESLGLSIRQLSKNTKIDFSLISKFESNNRKPSIRNLERIKKGLGLNENEYFLMLQLGGYSRGGDTHKMEDRNSLKQNQIEVKMPESPVLYTDSVLMAVTEFGIVFDFAQREGATNKHNVVARLGMSKEHAVVLADKIVNLLENEKSRQRKILEEKINQNKKGTN